MRSWLAVGVILMILGAAVLAWPVITYTDRDTVIDLGQVEVSTENTEHLALPPVLGGVAVAAGAALVLFAGRRRTA